MSIRLVCYAPIDAWVEEAFEGPVAVAEEQVIVRLRSPELDRKLQITEVLLAHLELASKPLYDGRVDELVSRVPKDIDILRNVISAARKFDSTIAKPLRGRAKLQTATLEQGLAHMLVMEKHISNRVEGARAQIEIAKATIQRERSILSELLASLIIRAPRPGRATTSLLRGQFVGKGDVCGELET